MNRKINVYGFSVINSGGYDNGNESITEIFNSYDSCLAKGYEEYVNIYRECEADGVLDQEIMLSFDEFTAAIRVCGYAYIQCYDSHILVEFFNKELELLPEHIIGFDGEQTTCTEKAIKVVDDVWTVPDGRKIFALANIAYMLKESDSAEYFTHDELLGLTERIAESSFMSDVPLLTAERVDAVRALLEYGVDENRLPVLPSLSPEKTKELLLTCDMEIFVDLVEFVALENQSFYAPEYSQPFEDRMSGVLAAIEHMAAEKSALVEQVAEAAGKLQGSNEPMQEYRSKQER